MGWLDNNAFILNMGRDFVSSGIYERLWESPFFYPVVMGGFSFKMRLTSRHI
jgi:hypothetical protein